MSNVSVPQTWWGEAPEGPWAVARVYDESLRLVTLGRKIRRAVGIGSADCGEWQTKGHGSARFPV